MIDHPLPNCIYTREGEYANCNHQHKHFKEVTHEKTSNEMQFEPNSTQKK